MRQRVSNVSTIQALIFDFDGLIVDTESPWCEVWREIYRAHGCSLPVSQWAKWISSTETPDPCSYLSEQLGRPVDRSAIHSRWRARYAALLPRQPVLPGVEACIFEAGRRGLRLGVASSAPRAHVLGNLERLGLASHFDSIHCADDVERVKPDPALYLAAMSALAVSAGQAIALEDSPNGVLAAKRAGLFCVAVPNALTRQLALDEADLRIDSLVDLDLDSLPEQVQSRRMRWTRTQLM